MTLDKNITLFKFILIDIESMFIQDNIGLITAFAGNCRKFF